MPAPMPKVVVVTRTKDRPLMLKRAVQSVLDQSFHDWQHVIVNDGGEPTAVDSLVSLFQDDYRGRLKVLHNETPMGMQNASNRAIQESVSEYIVIHDDDDSWRPDFLRECIDYLDKPGIEDTVQGVAAQVIWVFEEIDRYGNIVELGRQDYFPFKDISLFRTAGNNAFPPIAFLYRRQVHEYIGYFNQSFDALGDWDFNLRFLSKFDIGVIDRQLALYHWRRGAVGTYGNTVTAGIEKHARLAVKMRNHYLRKDLEEGRMGLGFLLNLSETMQGHSSMLWDLTRKADHTHHELNRLHEMSRYFERITCDLCRLWRFKRFLERAGRYFYKKLQRRPKPPTLASAVVTDPSRQLLNQDLSQFSVLSLDIFDTSLLRKVKRPIDVFLYMQEAARTVLQDHDLRFVDLRVNAEAIARRRAAEQYGHGDTNLDEIYAVVQELTGISKDKVGTLIELEIASERKLLYPNPRILEFCRMAESRERKIIFTSDMYLPASLVKQLLETNGFHPERILLSSEQRLTKHSGELFELLLQENGGEPDRVLHIGDNPRADVEQAQKKGLQAIHWRPSEDDLPYVDQIDSYSSSWGEDLASSMFTGLAQKRRWSRGNLITQEEEFWRSIGYEVIGPLYFSFVHWVATRATDLEIERLFFLARDGYHLVKVFELLNKHWKLPLDAVYMYSSRRLLNVSRITTVDDEALTFLASPNPCMQVRHFLERIDLRPASYKNLPQRHGFEVLEQVVTTKDGVFVSTDVQQRIRRLLKDLEPAIVEQAAAERTKLLAYFAQLGFGNTRSAVVDVGWQASSIKSLQDLLHLAGTGGSLFGLYFGTWRFARPAVDSGCHLESFFMHLDQPRHRAEILAESVELLESLFWAPHSTIVGLENVNGRWEAIYGDKEIDRSQQRCLESATQAAFEFVQDAAELIGAPGSTAPPYAYLETVLERILRHPKAEEAEILGRFAFRNSFGGSGPLRYLAKLPAEREALLDPEALQRAYDYCYWKKGFIAQMSPRQRQELHL